MALSAELTKLLNDFADSQPALRLSGQPFGLSNPKLGDALNAEFVAAAGSSSAAAAAASAAAAALSATDAQTAQTAAEAAQAAAEAAAAYTPAVTANWTGADPTTVAEALDRIAAALGPIA